LVVLVVRPHDNGDRGRFPFEECQNLPLGGTRARRTGSICLDGAMARRGFIKLRPTPWALTIAAWDIWRRLPPEQRHQLLVLARRHGPRLASKAAKSARRKK
jgi:hypothetical protein